MTLPDDSAASALVRLFASQTVLEFDDGRVVTLAVGAGELARGVLRHDPPTPVELERGIDVIEEALGAARLDAGPRRTLRVGESAVRGWPGLEAPDAVLPIESVEALFQRLASRALGTPVPTNALPEGSEVAAALLLLRECMHHLGFSQLARQD